MPRKTDSKNPADWLHIVDSDMEVLRMAVREELGHSLCRSKLAEVLEKTIKAELIRIGWRLEKTHDLETLQERLDERSSDLVSLTGPLGAGLAEAYFTDRYPGFDLDDPDWPKLRRQLGQIEELLAKVKARLPVEKLPSET